MLKNVCTEKNRLDRAQLFRKVDRELKARPRPSKAAFYEYKPESVSSEEQFDAGIYAGMQSEISSARSKMVMKF